MSRSAALLTVSAVAACLLLAGCGGVPSGAVATVGGVPVTRARFDQYLRQMLGVGTALPRPGTRAYELDASSAVSSLVQEQVVIDAAPGLKVAVTAGQVGAQIARMAAAEGGVQKLYAAARQIGIAPDQLGGYVRDEMLAQAVYQKVVARFSPTRTQMLAYYRSHKSRYEQPATRAVRQVLVRTRGEALRVRALLVADPSDATWARVAGRYSIDEATRDRGGDLGAITPGEMLPPVTRAAFSLPVGAVSQPVHSRSGWHVLEVTAITPARVTSFAAATPSIESTLVTQGWQYWLTWTQKGTKIVYAVGYDPLRSNAGAAGLSSTHAAAAVWSRSPSPVPSARG
jgi:parvulin-like peptidyl-prolyl isomerase